MTNALCIGTSAIRTIDSLYSLNDLHKAAGGNPNHRPLNFLRLESTKSLIEEIAKFPEMGTLAVKVIQGRNGGTYACRELVIAYAAWISAAFHLKVIRVFLSTQAPAQPRRRVGALPAEFAWNISRLSAAKQRGALFYLRGLVAGQGVVL